MGMFAEILIGERVRITILYNGEQTSISEMLLYGTKRAS
jgi:hypothetical protein